MSKRITSLVLSLCFILSLAIIIPNDALFTDVEAALNYNGGTRNSATFIIDPGHGGADPGAVNGSRHEADDVLRLSIAVAKLIDQSGSSCALTRVTDITQSMDSKVYIANSGSFTYFLSIHRNAGGGKGVETYYHSSLSASSTSAKLATHIQNNVIAIGCWVNRGVKSANFKVIRETVMSGALIEVGFMDSPGNQDSIIFDQYFDANAKAIANGMLAMVGKSVTPDKTVVAPTISTESVVAHNQALTVNWGAVTHALSYKYKVESFEGEMSSTPAKIIVAETSTTGTSFTIPAQATGKYYKITVTSVGEKNTAEATAIVMVGPWVAYPQNKQYIPITSINGSVVDYKSSIITKGFTTSMTLQYWRAAMLAPNPDGSYTVSTIFEEGVAKTINISGNNIMFIIHSATEGYEYAKKIAVGDRIDLCGIYIDKNTIRGTGYILVNGGTPDDITTTKPELEKLKDTNTFRGMKKNTTVSSALAMFDQDKDFLRIYKADGTELADTDLVSTGCTVNVVVNGNVSISYDLVVSGDINGDGSVSAADYVVQKKVIKGDTILEGAFAIAVDFNCDDVNSSLDYIALCAALSN